MRKYEYPFFADWFAISLRWLVLVGVAYSLVLANTFNYWLVAAVLAGILWNFLSTLLAVFNRRLSGHRVFNVLFDFFGTGMLFFFSRGFYGPLSWVGLLNLFSAGIYFGWGGSLVMAVIISALQILGSIYVFDIDIAGANIALLAGFNILSGLLFGFLSQQLYTQLRDHFQRLQKERSQSDEKVRLAEQERMQQIIQMLVGLHVSHDYKAIMQSALELCTHFLEKMGGSSPLAALMSTSGEKLEIKDAHGFPAGDIRLAFPAKAGALKQAVQSRVVTQLDQPCDDPELGQMLGLRECGAALLLPLNCGPEMYGLMLFAHPEGDYFNNQRQELLKMISHHTAGAVQNALNFQELKADYDLFVCIQEDERNQIARELHDGPTQSVSGMAMRAEFIRRLLDKGAEKNGLMLELEQLEALARKSTQGIRKTLYALQPQVLKSEGLSAALDALAENMKEGYQQEVSLEIDVQVADRLSLGKQIVLFQIVQQAVNIVSTHTEASLIGIHLVTVQAHSDLALLEVKADEAGVDAEEVQHAVERRSAGILSLRERAGLIDGHLSFESSPEEGTCIQVTVPLTELAADWLKNGITGR